jgi:hypothetical protein
MLSWIKNKLNSYFYFDHHDLVAIKDPNVRMHYENIYKALNLTHPDSRNILKELYSTAMKLSELSIKNDKLSKNIYDPKNPNVSSAGAVAKEYRIQYDENRKIADKCVKNYNDILKKLRKYSIEVKDISIKPTIRPTDPTRSTAWSGPS